MNAKVDVQEAVKAARERQAAAADPNNKPEAKQVMSTAGTDSGARVQAALEATQTGAPTAAKIMDPVSGIRGEAATQVPEPAKVEEFVQLPTKEDLKGGSAFRVFRHAFAGATTIMPNGHVIHFGGGVGGSGYYATDKQKEIEFLEDLTKHSGSQVTEPESDASHTPFVEDQLRAREFARANTAHFSNPNALKAFENLDKTIKHNSD